MEADVVSKGAKTGILFRRFAALFVDLLVVIALYVFLYLGISGIIFGDKMADAASDAPWRIAAIYTFLIAVPVLYFSLMESCFLKGTIGKLVLGLRVERQNGNRIPYYFGLVRGVVKFVSVVFFPLLLIGLFTKGNKEIHDLLSGSVVRDRPVGTPF